MVALENPQLTLEKLEALIRQVKSPKLYIRDEYAPRATRSMRQAIQELHLDHLWGIYPGNQVVGLMR